MCGRTALSIATLLCLPALGQAQERGHAAAVLGWTFGENTSSLFGAQFGAGLGDSSFSVVGGIENLDDILTGRYALFLEDIGGIPGVEVSAKVPGVYYGGGLRWTYRHGFRLVPYAQVEFGATRIEPEISVLAGGEDVTDELFRPGELDETAFTFALGGGVRADIGTNFLFEAAFKFFDVFTEEELSLNRLSFAFGLRF
jgi:opacity protein-like surface antigen